MTMGDAGHQPLALVAASARPGHFRRQAGFIDEDDVGDAFRVGQEPGLAFAPNHAGGLDI